MAMTRKIYACINVKTGEVVTHDNVTKLTLFLGCCFSFMKEQLEAGKTVAGYEVVVAKETFYKIKDTETGEEIEARSLQDACDHFNLKYQNVMYCVRMNRGTTTAKLFKNRYEVSEYMKTYYELDEDKKPTVSKEYVEKYRIELLKKGSITLTKDVDYKEVYEVLRNVGVRMVDKTTTWKDGSTTIRLKR